MRWYWPVAVVVAGCCPALVQAQESAPKALEGKVTAVAWPPRYMQDLPGDYLDRQHASLVAGTMLIPVSARALVLAALPHKTLALVLGVAVGLVGAVVVPIELWLALAITGLLTRIPVVGGYLGLLEFAVWICMIWYIFRAMRVYYTQSRALTFSKYVVLGVAYLSTSITVLMLTVIYSALTLEV